VRIPAVEIPHGADAATIEAALFDDELNQFYFEKVARWCYRPAIKLWRELLDRGMALGLGIPISTLPQFEAWDPNLLGELKALLEHENCEPVATEPYHAVSMLLDLPLFARGMERSAEKLAEICGQRPRVADTTEMLMSSDIARTLARTGFEAGFVDGRPWIMEWRSAAHVYRERGGLPLLARHFDLSDDVGYRFSNQSWDGWPLTADRYADWVASTPGDLVTLAWDFETFGEHHNVDTGIFEFMDALPDALAKRGIRCLTPSAAIEVFDGEAHDLPMSPFPATWAGQHGGLEFFLGNHAQQAVFRLMTAAYGTAQLTEDPALIDLAHLLLQSDNLHWLQWVGKEGSEADVSAYFTPNEWMWLGADRLLWEHQRVYINFIDAIS